MIIYLAGGMKSKWQDKVMTACPAHEFIDPRTHGLTSEKEYTAWDLAGVRRSDLVLAYMDSDNPSGYGLALEVGYASALFVPIWYVCEDTTARQRYFGMVRACSDKLFSDLDEAIRGCNDL